MYTLGGGVDPRSAGWGHRDETLGMPRKKAGLASCVQPDWFELDATVTLAHAILVAPVICLRAGSLFPGTAALLRPLAARARVCCSL